jgi:hypothetical protein
MGKKRSKIRDYWLSSGQMPVMPVILVDDWNAVREFVTLTLSQG